MPDLGGDSVAVIAWVVVGDAAEMDETIWPLVNLSTMLQLVLN